MTIAVSLKVNDGVVLAADSAMTLFNDKGQVINVYNNANKIVNLYEDLPIGLISWGSGSIGNASISTLAKDLRHRFKGKVAQFKTWKLNPKTYTLERVAHKTREFFFDELYSSAYSNLKKENRPRLGIIIAGYSAGEQYAEEWQIQIDKGECDRPNLLRKKEYTGINWRGETEIIYRILWGYGTKLSEALEKAEIAEDKIEPVIEQIGSMLALNLCPAPMPIKDAIDLAEFFVDVTIKCSRFSSGAPTVGGPIKLAVITKHEGFKWVKKNL